MRENSAKKTEPAAEKLSLRAVAGGERKQLAGTVTAPVSGAEGDGDKPLISAIPMPQVMPEEEPSMDEEPASKKALTSVRLPVRRKRSIRDLGERKTPDQETEAGSADASEEAPVTEADERPADEGSVIGEENAKANEVPEPAETEDRGMEDADTSGEISEELNDTAGAANAEVSAQGAAGPETEPAGTEEPLKETAPREDNIIKTGPPPEPARSRALSDILDQARELFPSGYDRPAAAQDPAKGDQGDTLKLGERQGRKAGDRRTPMQRNTKWESEMEDVMRGAGKKAEQGVPPRPKQDVKPKQSETAADRKADDSVPNPFPETFPNSKWRKVTYPGTNRYYLEGEATGPNGRFQIAALPGEYSAVPPQRAKGFDRFIRAADGCGYWLRLMKR
jgi:hypothetical protein